MSANSWIKALNTQCYHSTSITTEICGRLRKVAERFVKLRNDQEKSVILRNFKKITTYKSEINILDAINLSIPVNL